MPLVGGAAHEYEVLRGGVQGCADSSAATESEGLEGADTRSLVRHSEQQPEQQRAARIGGSRLIFSGVMVVMGVSAVGRSMSSRPARAQETLQAAQMVSAVVSTDALPVAQEGYGCVNFETVRLALHKFKPTVEECYQACKSQAGCTGFGYQPDTCSGDEQLSKGACYLWHGQCTLGENKCWTNYILPVAERKPETWALREAKSGCANWESAKLAEPTLELSAGACGTKCTGTDGCTSWNFQPDNCTGEQIERGACYLFGEACEREDNHCWSLYDALAVTTLTSASGAAATTLETASRVGFAVGDDITITNTATPEKTEKRSLTAISPRLAFATPLTHSYPAGATSVTTPLKA